MIRRLLMPLLGALLLVGITLLSLSPSSADSGDGPDAMVIPWKQAIQKIEADRIAGKLTVDEAAWLRWQAVAEPMQLPLAYRPDPDVLAEWQAPPIGDEPPGQGMALVGEGIAALFADQDQWKPETRDRISQAMAAHEQHSLAQLDAVTTTAHFKIHWATNGPAAPAGCNEAECPYVITVAQVLEQAWHQFGVLGYDLPPPGYYHNPASPLIDVHVVSQTEVLPCSWNGLSPHEPGISFPGEIRFVNTLHPDEIPSIVTHEAFHQVQWRAVGFRTHGCPFWYISMGEWYYLERNGWLLEDSAVWMERQLLPTKALSPDGRYRGFVRRYLREKTGTSLFDASYDGALFFTYLTEKVAPAAGYAQPETLMLDVWQAMANQNLMPQDKSSKAAVSTILQRLPPSHNTWGKTFTAFAIANYQQDYNVPTTSIFNTPTLSVPILGRLQPQANPLIPFEQKVLLTRGAPAAQYYEFDATRLNVATGADATGATLHLKASQDSGVGGAPTIGVLLHSQSGALLRRDFYEVDWGFQKMLTTTFGIPTDAVKGTLVFVQSQEMFPPGIVLLNTRLTATDNPPIAPRTLSASVVPGSITLKWGAVRETGIRYRIYRSTTSPVPVTDATRLVDNHTATSYTDQTVSCDRRFYYVVTAVDTGNNEGPASPERSNKFRCATPTPSPTPTATPSATPTATPSPTATATPAPTATPSPPGAGTCYHARAVLQDDQWGGHYNILWPAGWQTHPTNSFQLMGNYQGSRYRITNRQGNQAARLWISTDGSNATPYSLPDGTWEVLQSATEMIWFNTHKPMVGENGGAFDLDFCPPAAAPPAEFTCYTTQALLDPDDQWGGHYNVLWPSNWPADPTIPYMLTGNYQGAYYRVTNRQGGQLARWWSETSSGPRPLSIPDHIWQTIPEGTSRIWFNTYVPDSGNTFTFEFCAPGLPAPTP